MDSHFIKALEDVGAQRLVVIGRSGLMRAGYAFAKLHHLGNPMVVRKPGEVASYHEGATYNTWNTPIDGYTFVDDTIDSGRTLWRVVRALARYGGSAFLRSVVVTNGVGSGCQRVALWKHIPSLAMIHAEGMLYRRPEEYGIAARSLPGVSTKELTTTVWERVPW